MTHHKTIRTNINITTINILTASVKYISHFMIYMIILISITLIGCDDVFNKSAQNSKAVNTWNNIFINRTNITPAIPDTINPLGSIRSIDIQDSTMIIPDGMNGRILVVNDKRNIVHIIGQNGQGPGEFQLLSSISTDSTGSIHAFDVNGYSLHKYKMINGTLEYDSVINMNNNITQIKIYDSNIITYSLSHSDLISIYDTAGTLIKSAFTVTDDDLRKRMLRFQGGGMDVSKNGMIYAIYPGMYEIRVFDSSIRAVDTLLGMRQSEWRPVIPESPRTTSPYGFTEKDKDWWGSFLHIGRLHLIDDKRLLVWLYEMDKDDNMHQYVNIYTINGKILSEGLAVPDGEYIIGAGNGSIYTSMDPRLSKQNMHQYQKSQYHIENTTLYRYDLSI